MRPAGKRRRWSGTRRHKAGPDLAVCFQGQVRVLLARSHHQRSLRRVDG